MPAAADSCCPAPLAPHAPSRLPGPLRARVPGPAAPSAPPGPPAPPTEHGGSTHGAPRSHSPSAALKLGGDQGDRGGAQVPGPAIFPHAQCASPCTCAPPSMELSRAHGSSPAAGSPVSRRMDPRRGWRGKRKRRSRDSGGSERVLPNPSRRTAGSERPGTMTHHASKAA